MIDKELVHYHDGELPQSETERVREAVEADPGRRDELEIIRQIDRAVAQLDRLSAPSPEHVAGGKAALKARLHRHVEVRRRRWLAAVAVASTSVAATVAIVWYVGSDAAIGTARYGDRLNAAMRSREEKLRLGSVVRALEDLPARIELPGIGEMTLTGKGVLKIGDRLHDVKLVSGNLLVNSRSRLRILLDESPYVVTVEPDSSLLLRRDGGVVRVEQQWGRSLVVGGPEDKVLEGRRKLFLGPSPPEPSRDPG